MLEQQLASSRSSFRPAVDNATSVQDVQSATASVNRLHGHENGAERGGFTQSVEMKQATSIQNKGKLLVGRGKGGVKFKSRDDLGAILEARGFTVGAELGVQRGLFAESTLKQWRSAKTYVLVDVWAPMANYQDIANVNSALQNQHFDETQRRVARFRAAGTDIPVCRNLTSVCVRRFPDHYFDYIYVHSQHSTLNSQPSTLRPTLPKP